MKCTCCVRQGDGMFGEGAISQSSPSKALRLLSQSRFFLFTFPVLHKFCHMTPATHNPFSISLSPPFLPPARPRPAPASARPWRSSVGLVGLVALTSHHAGCTAQPIRDALFVLLVFSHVTDIENKRKTVKMRLRIGLKVENLHLDFVSFSFSFSLKVHFWDSCKITVCCSFPSGLLKRRRNSLCFWSPLRSDCVASFPEHCLSQKRLPVAGF